MQLISDGSLPLTEPHQLGHSAAEGRAPFPSSSVLSFSSEVSEQLCVCFGEGL